MRLGCALTAVVIATAACGSSAAAPTSPSTTAARSASAGCGPKGARTLVIDSQARVYAVGNNVFGCAGSAGHPYGLGQNPTARPGQERVGRIALAGVDAAYALSQMGVDTFSTQVIVRRLDNGQTLHDVSATTQTLGPEFFQTVETIVVKADGAVAWIAQGGSIVRHEGDFEVDRIDRRGETTLDHSATGNLRSLRLRGSELSWRHGAQVRTATLI